MMLSRPALPQVLRTTLVMVSGTLPSGRAT